MGKKNADVAAYLEGCPEAHRGAMEALRKLVHKAQPNVVESIQYKMLAFSCGGEMFCGLCSRKNYISLYCKPEVVDQHREGLGKLNVGKGCIRFTRLDQVPMDVIRAILVKSCSGSSQ